MPDLSWVPLAQDVALLVCLVVCLVVCGAIAVVGLVYLNDRSGHVAASPQQQAHEQGAERARAGGGHAAAPLHRLPARRGHHDAVAARAPRPRVEGRADDVRELRPRARVLPVVQASVQPGGGRSDGRGRDERASGRGDASGSRTAALVTPIASKRRAF